MLACIALVSAFTGLSARLVYVQIVKHDEYAERAMVQRSHREVLPAHRGRIYDAGGELLADSFPTQNIVADRNVLRNIRVCVRGMAHAYGLKPKDFCSQYEDEEIRQMYAERVAGVISGAIGEGAANKIRAMAKPDSKRSVVVQLERGVAHDNAADLAEFLKVEKLSGILFEDSMKRYYPNPRSMVHVLGILDYEGQGVSGIERELNARLAGTDGSRSVERDGHHEEIGKFRGETIDAIDGEDVHLTIHLPLQRMVEKALERLVARHHPEKVSAIFMDPFTGEILAMANYPSFDLKTRKGNLKNFAITDRYEPGSTFKVVSLSACYDSGAVSPSDQINCWNGVYRDEVGRFTLRDHHSYGMKSPGMVLAKSSNIGTYMMVKEMGKHTFYTYIRDFGFGSRTGIALTGEVSGTVHKPNSPYWSKTSLSRVGMGYEVDVTPLQMLNAMCAVANGGNLMQPQIVKRIEDVFGEASYTMKPHKVRRVISEETAEYVRQAMLLVTGKEGTGKLGAVEGYPTAAKTGTALKPKEDRSKGYYKGRYVSSFMGFLPAENPRLAGIIVVDDPRGKDHENPEREFLSRYGGSVAGPVFREIATEAMRYMGVEPSVIPRLAVRTKGPMSAVRYAPSGGAIRD